MSRLEEISEWLPDKRSGALVTSKENLRYLTGYDGEALLVVTKERCCLFVASGDEDRAKRTVTECRVCVSRNMHSQLLELLLSHNVSRIYIEPEKTSVKQLERLRECVHYAEILTTDELSEKLFSMRSVKSEQEIAYIEKAQSVADTAYKHFISDVRRGMSEKQAAGLLSCYILSCGADALAFPVVVLSGENTAKKDAQSSDRKLAAGDFLVVRFGAVYRGYCSATARTIAVGEVSERMEEYYNAVVSAVSDAVDVLGAGRGGKLPYSVAKSTLNSWGGLDAHFGGELGSGIGLSLREPPVISEESRAVLREGMVFTIDPAIRVTGEFGVSVQDTVLITENGCKILSNATKTLIHI